MIYFLDGNGKVCHQHLINIDKKWSAIRFQAFKSSLYDYWRKRKIRMRLAWLELPAL